MLATSRLFASLHPQLPRPRFRVTRALDLGCGDRPIFGEQRFADSEFGADLVPFKSEMPFVACEGSLLPFAGASFDLVIARVAVPYMRLPAALREIGRVLVPGGHLWATLHLPRMALKRIHRAAKAADFADVVFQSYALLNCALLRLVPTQLPWIDGRFESVQTPAGIRRALLRCGFSNVETEICPDEEARLHFAVLAQKATQTKS